MFLLDIAKDSGLLENADACKNMRISKIYKEVTLKGGISSGEFIDKGHISDMTECINKCCAQDTCNVAFVIKETCFAVKCKSYEDCGLKPAVSQFYSPKIAYVNWSPPQSNLGDDSKIKYDFMRFLLTFLNAGSTID